MNVPHSWVPTGHFGWTFQIGEAYSRRVRFIGDVDLRAGSIIARQRSIYIDTKYETLSAEEAKEDRRYAPGAIRPIVGISAGVGLTF